jgi:hypothetical protein
MTLQEDQLAPFAFELLELPESCREAITIDPPRVLVASLANLPVERGLERIAMLEQGSSSTLIVRFYTAAPLSISGSCSYTDEFGSQTVSYGIDAPAGWSLVETTNGGSSTVSETNLSWLAYPPGIVKAVGSHPILTVSLS